jgi:DNA processing protein
MKRAYEYSIAAQVWTLREFGEVGPRGFRALMAHFENLPAILEADIERLNAVTGLGKKRAEKINECFKSIEESEVFLNGLKEREIGYSTIFDDDYPTLFMELNDPPPIIFYRGRLPEKSEKTVAIVGSHKATGEGIKNSVDLAAKLTKDVVSIVSGLARGIDAAAHLGAISNGGHTYAVLGSGFDHILPEENIPLAGEIIKSGGLISEYPPDAHYSTGRIMARNRLTVGLSQAVIVAELFGDSNGTLDTATFCHELGKLMFVLIDGCDLPGRDNAGVTKVLSLGAIPITLEKGLDLVKKSLI